MTFCSKCGMTLSPENNICPNCGQVVNNDGVANQVAQVPNVPIEAPTSPVATGEPTVAPTSVAPAQVAASLTADVAVGTTQPNIAPTPQMAPAPGQQPMGMPTQAEVPVQAPTPVELVLPEIPAVEPQLAVPTSVPVQPVETTPVPQVIEQPVTRPTPVPPTVAVEPPQAQPPVLTTETVLPTAPEPNVAQPPALEPTPAMAVEPTLPPVPDAQVPPVIPTTPEVNTEVSIPDSTTEGAVQEETKKKKTPDEKEKKFNRITTFIIIIISIISIAIIAVFMYKIVKENEACEGENSTLTTQYSYEGFEFFLPKGVLASVEDNEFVLHDAENTWSAVITINDGAYNTLVSNKSQISGYFENIGYVSNEAQEKEVSGTSFVTTEVLMGSQNVLIAYAKASGTKIYGIVYTNELGTYDDYSLSVVGEVLASAIYSGYDSAMPAGFTIDLFEETFDAAR